MTLLDTERLVEEIKKQLDQLSSYTAEIGLARKAAGKTQDAATQVVDLVTQLSAAQQEHLQAWQERLAATRATHERSFAELVEQQGTLQNKLSDSLDAKTSAQQSEQHRLFAELLSSIKREHSELIQGTQLVLSSFSNQVGALDHRFASLMDRQQQLTLDIETFRDTVQRSNDLSAALITLQRTQAELTQAITTTSAQHHAALDQSSTAVLALQHRLQSSTSDIAAGIDQIGASLVRLEQQVSTQDEQYRALLTAQATRQTEVLNAMLAEAGLARQFARVWQWGMLGGVGAMLLMMALLLLR